MVLTNGFHLGLLDCDRLFWLSTAANVSSLSSTWPLFDHKVSFNWFQEAWLNRCNVTDIQGIFECHGCVCKACVRVCGYLITRCHPFLMREINPEAVSLFTRRTHDKKFKKISWASSHFSFFLPFYLLWCMDWTWQSRVHYNDYKVLIWHSFRCEPRSLQMVEETNHWPFNNNQCLIPHPPPSPPPFLPCASSGVLFVCVRVYGMICGFSRCTLWAMFFPLGVSLADPPTPLSLRTAS